MRYLGATRVVEDANELARASDWILHPTRVSGQVCYFVPDVFPDYARVFHPAAELEPPREVSWSEVAEANGKIAHAGMQWNAITGYEIFSRETQPGLWDESPRVDSLPLNQTRVLCEILATFTSTPDRCWCAEWEGYADMVGLRGGNLPHLELPGRTMIVGYGPLGSVPEKSFTDGFEKVRTDASYQSPSLWWPDDRAWLFASDVDFDSTYIGASASCVDRLIGDPRLEAMRVTADQGITYDSDTLNLPLSG